MKSMRIAIAALALSTMASAAQAQNLFGVQVDYGTGTNIGLGVGGRYMTGLGKLFTSGPMSKAMFTGSFDYFFMDCQGASSCSYWELNPGIAFPVGTSSLNPYVGGGIVYAHSSVTVSGGGFSISGSSSETGLNVFGGSHFPIGAMAGFSEGRYELRSGGQLVLTAGIMFGKAKM